ncbi:MAG: TldD/PmbA family protein [Chloroflexota bacterium]
MTRIHDRELRAFLREQVREMERKVPYAAVFVTSSRQLVVDASLRQERVSETGPTAGAVVTVWNGDHFEECATSDISRDGIARAARALTASVAVHRSRLEVPVARSMELFYKTPCEQDPSRILLEEKLDLCRRARDRAANLDPRVVEAGGRYSERHVETLFVNRSRDLAQEIVTTSFGPYCVAADGNVVRQDGESNGGTGGYELAAISEEQWSDLGQRIPGLLRATPVEPGSYDVVVAPAVAGLIAHEAFGHGVETDMFLKGRARSREYVGKAVGSERVDLFDDPTYPGGFGTYAFDDEGQTAAKTQVLRQGVFVQGLTDLNAAMRLGLPRTANGRRQDVNKAYARMTNTYFGAGSDRLEDMIASIDRGVYMGMAESGMEDPKDWGVQCVIAWGRVIEHGKLTDRYHTQIGLTGYVPGLLGSVSMVGGGIKLFGGGCGKGHKEIISVGMGGPHIKMKARLG